MLEWLYIEMNLDYMMDQAPILQIPLRTDADGTLRVGQSRVTFDVLIGHYNQGYSAPDLKAEFDHLSLTDIYAVIAYYLANQTAMDGYLHQREVAAQKLRSEIEAGQTPLTRTELLARRDGKRD